MRPIALAVLLALATAGAAPAAGGLHGTVTTRDGRTLTGALRWDENEIYWDQILSGTKEEEIRVERPEEERTFRFLGLRLPSWGDDETVVRHSFAVPVGHVRMLEPEGPDWARVTLKSGETVRVQSSGSDLGRSFRGLEITPAGGEPLTLEWADLERVEFSPGPADDSRDGERIYGEVMARAGAFTGHVAWDRDEFLLEEELDGEAGGVDHAIPFREIDMIERVHSRASRVTLAGGDVMELSGTNDVNDDNRGIEVTLTGGVRVTVPWEEFVRFRRLTPPAAIGYQAYDGGRRLRGVVLTADGTTHEGLIRWDRDEIRTWESLDGDADGLSWAVPFDHIRTITRRSRRGCRVELTDGRTLELSGSNDVDEDNKGVVVTGPDGSETMVTWEDFQELRLQP
jgi:hypothetical protein